MSSAVPDGWVQTLIGDIGSFFGGLTGKTAKDFGDGHPFLTYMQVFLQKTSDKDRVNFVSINESEKQNRVDYGDILFTTSSETPNEIGMTAVFLEEDWSPYLNSFCFGLRVESPSSIDPLFAKYVLRGDTFREDMRPLAQGSTRFNLSKGNLAKLNLLLPSLPEQKRIASILTSVDEVIENTQKQIDKLQDLKKATMNELLTKGIGHTEFKDSELGRIPKSWEVTTLGKLARFDSGYAFKNRELAEEGIKIVRISNLHKPNFPYWHFASEYKSTWVVEKGDVLFSWAGVANSINIHRYQGERALINQHIYNFKFESEALKEWTFQVMKYLLPKLKESIEGGAGQLHLTKPFIQAIGIVLPTQSERLRILELSGSLDKQINTVERKLAQTQSLKKSLMQDLLTGKVRVTVN